ncbi:PREDICTED: ankyrin repeat and SOCS box protein 18 [Rhinopithecus bieti]|uniref:ankyrin repeat and SOCS box protein 18 n=1 Tax=Rhinopithecus bieti TaxID=61621 RepID=UPI00083BC73C|nr:PREDICTED: ankyrin repeat and SOCS box protein 18 [Rhinopithecus bieti]
MSNSDYLPDYPLNSDLVKRLKSALDAKDEERVGDLICTEVTPVDAVIELANDDWMKDPSAQLPPGMLLGDLEHLKPLMDQFFQDANVVFEISKDEMEWQVKSPATFGLSGLWTLEYKRELTTPLCIAAAHGHTACVRYLLGRGADPDASPGGRGALHEACLGATRACARLLLGASTAQPRPKKGPDLLSAEGLALCTLPQVASLGCAQALLEHGASVQRVGGKGRDTPLHVAAQRGLDEHARLYLDRGAYVDTRNGCGETALSAACGAARRPDEHGRCLRLCALLLRHGAEADARDEDERSPLHKACGHTAACALQAAPQRTVQALLNHGSPTVWPDAFPKTFGGTWVRGTGVTGRSRSIRISHPGEAACHVDQPRNCAVGEHTSPRVEGGSHKVCLPLQMHKPFYQSLFALAHTPRCLQHLCRCALRRLFGKRCFDLIPLLPLPKPLQNYVLLEPRGVLH